MDNIDEVKRSDEERLTDDTDPTDNVLNFDENELFEDWGAAQNEADQPDSEDDEEPPEEKPQEQFTLKHLSEIKTVGRDEIIALAQKGMDYDRQRQKVTELQAANDTLSKTGTHKEKPDETAVEELIGRLPVDLRERLKEKTPEELAAEKRQTDIQEILTEYGMGFDVKTVPPEVWTEVAKGKSLLTAYQAWELKKLRSESAAARKTAENAQKSAGSRQTAGAASHDKITDDWNNN